MEYSINIIECLTNVYMVERLHNECSYSRMFA